MRVYHFINATDGLDDIRKRRLKIARINELNDPFEFLSFAAKDAATRKRFKQVKSGLNDICGLLCFCATWRNPLMWSHYADKHKGICMGFDVSDSLLEKVNYVQERPTPDMGALSGKDSTAEAEMKKTLKTKFIHWQYEEEFRIFCSLESKDPKTGHYFQSFNNDVVLREAIVGPESSLAKKEISNALAGMPDEIKCRKARLAFKSFEVVTQQNPKLWS